MQKTILIYGVIASLIITSSIVLSMTLDYDPEHLAGLEYLGYLVMIVAFSMIFFGIKQYRDRALGGVMRYLTGLQVGLGITLVASVIYVVVWEINLAVTDYAFIHDYTAAQIEQRRDAGANATEMAEFVAEMDAMKVSYAKPLNRLSITFMEIFPVGLVIALISAAILRRSDVLPAANGGSAA